MSIISSTPDEGINIPAGQRDIVLTPATKKAFCLKKIPKYTDLEILYMRLIIGAVDIYGEPVASAAYQFRLSENETKILLCLARALEKRRPGYMDDKLAKEQDTEEIKKEIVVPAWNDIIHIARAPSYTERELAYMRDIGRQVDEWGRSLTYTACFFELSKAETCELLLMYRERKMENARRVTRALDMQASPSPALAKDLGVIMTAIDDVQDFTTTVGVVSRTLGRVFKPFDLLAIGAFTIGETLNRLNLLNRLTGGETSKLCRMLREMKNSSHKSTVKADVDKRMKRLFPTKGEALEMLQTADNLFGLGISLGPLVGLVQDIFFGRFVDAPFRFRAWEFTDAERRALRELARLQVGGLFDPSLFLGMIPLRERPAGYKVVGVEALEEPEEIDDLAELLKLLFLPPSALRKTGKPEVRPECYKVAGVGPPTLRRYKTPSGVLVDPLSPDFASALGNNFRMLESAANVIIAGAELVWNDFASALITFVENRIQPRAVGVKDAIIDIWEIISLKKITPPKKTKIETRLLLQGLGIDPYGTSVWPLVSLGPEATIHEIQEAYETQANKVLQYWRNKLGTSDEGLFLDACVKVISSDAVAMFCAKDGVITESLDPHILIYIKSLEARLNPPPDTSDEKFTEWMLFLKQQIDYYDIPVPDRRLLQEAHHRFFVV